MKKVLVANRGEIARRVLRTLKQMDIRSVAIYSDADANAPHVLEADEAVYVGKSPSAESYLQQDKIIQICKDLGVDGVHPGYGFLSENAGFARALKANGIKLIGPSPESMEVMGDKLSAKQAVKSYNVPLVPGVDEAISDVPAAKKIAAEVGYPILIKASAGGGGKGMRLVQNEAEFEEQMTLAQNEARSSFGDDAVFIEKFVDQPRHIEIQVFADQHGNAVYLFERECSVQRRHQKVVEEAPSAVLTPELRQQMGEAAVAVCKACNYEGAGTVEFLIDAKLDFYFLEMNTRLQVEHPVTEEITGLDLVEWQIRVARGERLPKLQDELTINGHAIEVRVYAEDTLGGFTPDIGTLDRYRIPSGRHIRVDDAFEEGMEIPIYYDPMIAKLVVWGKTREEAIDRCLTAIDNYQISGVKTTLDFGKFVLKHPAFRSGHFDTNFVKTHFSDPALLKDAMQEEERALVYALDTIWQDVQAFKKASYASRDITSSWKNQIR
ncbi:MAG: acetyl-CoA carboxylase biotin carboxylase subunit [Crocinitomicaceae bacterium]|jgi:acetyl-CoA carboxylase biotin carboxylase subunit|nr:acetyl-CoA carboxylase biotin carboxylase subunit [Crocinitomicaceae bacterium]MDP4722694.1 acetyl-CoA carboxylase biotin carboxylase subunit [Crocinitomicaceae bacterium]MDP4739158.1 acetyl-CoA carboxylase biotin carboxylase subunit [Crocinitomicaceae bacterium]MDP4799691.1 acetyl-CoA carboxylase biotin carboxylase subunit [Crocinitomicaceae bacterium]MDP4807295.1 acetyl-CoA carboxylase biotin carboxylase subunit [Crocinitomicaceae bacterium]